MYRMLQNDFEGIYTRIARNSILHIAGDYKAPDYWLNRTLVGDTVSSTLVDDLLEAYAKVTGFMLLKIDLPDVYEAAIVATIHHTFRWHIFCWPILRKIKAKVRRKDGKR